MALTCFYLRTNYYYSFACGTGLRIWRAVHTADGFSQHRCWSTEIKVQLKDVRGLASATHSTHKPKYGLSFNPMCYFHHASWIESTINVLGNELFFYNADANWTRRDRANGTNVTRVGISVCNGCPTIVSHKVGCCWMLPDATHHVPQSLFSLALHISCVIADCGVLRVRNYSDRIIGEQTVLHSWHEKYDRENYCIYLIKDTLWFFR